MTYCTGCGHQIHETAPACSQCGASQQRIRAASRAAEKTQGTLWLPVPALICALISAMSLFAPGGWTREQRLGAVILAMAALVLAVLALARQQRGSGLSIAALALGVIGLLGALGTQG